MLTFEGLSEKKEKIAVVGLGYVGLPLAVHLSRHFSVVGYDYKVSRIDELKAGRDRTLEVSEAQQRVIFYKRGIIIMGDLDKFRQRAREG